MDPTLMAYLHQLSDQGQANEENPLESGTQSGIYAAKQSLNMDEQEKKRAFGKAAMAFGRSVTQPGYGTGFAGTLNAINQSLGSAFQAYEGEEDKIAQRNAVIQDQMQRQAHLQKQLHQQALIQSMKAHQREREQETLQKHREAKLAETQGYHRGRLGMEERKLGQRGQIGADIAGMDVSEGIPLSSLPKKTQSDFGKMVLDSKKQIPAYKNVIETVNEMEGIFADHPNIGDSFVHMIEGHEDTLKGRIARQFTDKKTLTAIQRLKKLAADLNLETVKGFAGKTATDILKREIKAAAPNGVLTHDAFQAIADKVKKRAEQNIGEAVKYENSWKKGYIPLEQEGMEEEESQETLMQPELPQTAASQPIMMRLPDGRQVPIKPDKIAEARALGAVEIGE